MRVNTGLLALQLALACIGAHAQVPVPPSTFPEPSSTHSESSTSAQSTRTTVESTSTSASSTTPPFPTLSGLPPCVTDCLANGVAAASCSSLVDIDCFCQSDEFTNRYMRCIALECPSEEDTAQALAQQFCDLQQPSPSTSLSFPSLSFPSLSSTSSTSSTSASSSSSSSPSSSSSSTESDSTSTGTGTSSGSDASDTPDPNNSARHVAPLATAFLPLLVLALSPSL
ncbi:hypothetical protein AX16_006174 [Volvariella volvacea WC 439]|nr:hypothetical protein AX16_006174 [Volvariella volvacea WC 439]